MPIYAFSCNSCKKEFETLVRSSDTPECPSCGSTELTQQLALIASPGRGGEDAGSFSGGGSPGGHSCGGGCGCG
ncbi:MAG: zinc ribbon domain-containing protein [Hyphomicrobiaceae bacterium]|nr:zinc ribbon domain-containing protein [Hyphomicrobiaceae bacterium]